MFVIILNNYIYFFIFNIHKKKCKTHSYFYFNVHNLSKLKLTFCFKDIKYNFVVKCKINTRYSFIKCIAEIDKKKGENIIFHILEKIAYFQMKNLFTSFKNPSFVRSFVLLLFNTQLCFVTF